ncbi:MAG: hypothetical protein BWX88_02494 [Planctomycetes bacterium ADurb.Bin126]|nr:MAG: hypothetical protein BWX88_02494 [Planctomycetes bacterium ADurb.Bin126]
MIHDPVVEEVRCVKEKIAAQYGYDVRKIAKAMRAQQRRQERKKAASAPPARRSRKK